MGFKKKLHQFRPRSEPVIVETLRTRRKIRMEPSDPASIERGVRELLANKISGNMAGVWFLIPEHLRLGTYDLLCGWTNSCGASLEPRLALQVAHESALCITRERKENSLSQRGFEVANGLPFVATDNGIHDLFEARSVSETQRLQIALGRLRRVYGHFKGKLLACDPHNIRSYTQRQMRRHRHHETEEAVKALRTFFCLDVDTQQPVAFTIGSAAMKVSQSFPELVDMVEEILQPGHRETLILSDNEHLSSVNYEHINNKELFDLITPMSRGRMHQKMYGELSDSKFTRRWAGLATARLPYQFSGSNTQPLFQIIERCGETPQNYHYVPFLSTSKRDELDQICKDFPKRWHIEEFFNCYQAMGWNRAGTLNLHIRYAQLSMALLAQAVVYQMRMRLGSPYSDWEASHFGHHILEGLDGDIRVSQDTILVTFYNAPNPGLLRKHYQDLPLKLEKENVDPRIPWLFNFKLDFRFK